MNQIVLSVNGCATIDFPPRRNATDFARICGSGNSWNDICWQHPAYGEGAIPARMASTPIMPTDSGGLRRESVPGNSEARIEH